MKLIKMAALAVLSFVLLPATATAAVYGPQLEGFEYPYPVQQFSLNSQQQQLEMAYLDLPAAKPNGKVALLLHGKNFCAATWQGSIEALTTAGYRVIAPDQIGFCKSSKPKQYQFSFQQLAVNTKALLDKLNIKQVTVMGHSMGGMLATRFALLYPKETEQLVLVNPIGLEDWKALGVPYRTVDQWYQRELKTSAAGIKQYQLSTYYAGKWRPEFDRWVEMQAGMYQGQGKEQVAWNSALTAEMIFTQPVLYEFNQLKMPVLLMIGELDNTAIAKDIAPAELKPTLGNYAKLGPATVKAMPNASLVTFADLGHSPHIQDPERFHQQLMKELQAK
ncbi:Putative hydrolase or acyltransferase of alpha/beta superfamily [Rheinheimera sp. A13L]|uniref:alpha/beta fold hydrolase n=1 Tax=Rheinheimera sp. A13L TaxID=506534 RepID=UPI0002125285|nr:alpha/beta hydrolase [Rheinheimera sp. A13L]EGM79640.1 Putative hydrolase or acyltransferase of alpha/beta superfamily [Rheinheimera sp. A13L]